MLPSLEYDISATTVLKDVSNYGSDSIITCKTRVFYKEPAVFCYCLECFSPGLKESMKIVRMKEFVRKKTVISVSDKKW